MQDGIKKEADGSAAKQTEEETRSLGHIVDHTRMYDGFDDSNRECRSSDPKERLTGRPTNRPRGRYGETKVPCRAPCTKCERAIK